MPSKIARRIRALLPLSLLALPGLALAITPTAVIKNPSQVERHATVPQTAGVYRIPGPVNVLVNGNGDAEPGAPDSIHIVCPSHWTCDHNFTIVNYSVEQFPTANGPGPDDRGPNMFAGGDGGYGPVSTATQTIDLTSFAGRIATGQEQFTLSGYLGGWELQGDHADVSVTFSDASHRQLGAATNLPETTVSARHNNTGLVFQTIPGTVPVGATSATVTITMTETAGGYNDGYADSLALILN